MNQFDFQGKVAVVTGGAGGLGGAIVARLAASGAKVAVWDTMHPEQAIDGTISMVVDITNEEAVSKSAAQTLAQLGSVDILVNCAGITGPTKLTEDYTLAEWQKVYDVNMVGTLLCYQAFIAGMRAKNYGRIVNIASIAGKEGNPNLAAYASSKAAVIGFTKSISKELADTGITANAVAPGLILTNIHKQVTSDIVEKALAKIPMKRPGTLEEMGALVAWIASEDCSFTTGSVFDLTGGRGTY